MLMHFRIYVLSTLVHPHTAGSEMRPQNQDTQAELLIFLVYVFHTSRVYSQGFVCIRENQNIPLSPVMSGSELSTNSALCLVV